MSTIIESPTQRLRALLAARARRREERDFATRVCDETIAALHVVLAIQPDLQDAALYEAVVARRSGLDPGAASAVIQRANESLEDWGHDRPARFFDVVKYVIVSEYMAERPGTDGMIIDLGALLAPRIDPQL